MLFFIDKNGWKLLFAAFTMSVLVVGGVTAALILLREEAVITHLKIAKLHAATFSERLGQTIASVDYTLETISALASENASESAVLDAMGKALREAPYIRSINVLTADGRVILSSNPKNLNKKISLKRFIPAPAFDETIPRFSNSVLGRDVYDGVDIETNAKVESTALTYIPLLKKSSAWNGGRYFLVALNGDYFLREYLRNLDETAGYADILLIDGALLASTDKKARVGYRDPYVTKALSIGAEYADVNDGDENAKMLEAYAPTKNLPLAVAVRLSYDKSLKDWERKRLIALIATTALVVFSATLTLLLIFRYKRQRLLEEKILRSKMNSMGEMISMIAHQWRQPLAILSGINANILDAYKYDELTLEYLKKKNEQALGILKYLSKTIDDFRDFFRPDDKKSLFCLCEAIKESLKLIYPQVSADNIRLYLENMAFDDKNYTICQKSAIFFGYKNEFIHAMLAIIKNSAEAINRAGVKDGAIRVWVREKSDFYVVETSDNGGGVKEEIADKIFDPYFTTKHDYIGVGMGLYAAKSAIEKNMNGKLYFKNEGKGARFFIELTKKDESAHT